MFHDRLPGFDVAIAEHALLGTAEALNALPGQLTVTKHP